MRKRHLVLNRRVKGILSLLRLLQIVQVVGVQLSQVPIFVTLLELLEEHVEFLGGGNGMEALVAAHARLILNDAWATENQYVLLL